MDAELLHFESFGDDRGCLVSLEHNKQVPFPIARVYYIFGTKQGIKRGHHAHRNLQQVAVCVSGSCQFELFDGKDRREVALDSPTKGLYIGNMVWREMSNFSRDCVLMVLASRVYDEADYIRDYQTFLDMVRI